MVSAACLLVLQALVIVLGYLMFSDNLVVGQIMSDLPESFTSLSDAQRSLVLNDIRNLASDGMVSANPDPAIVAAAGELNSLRATASSIAGVIAIGFSLLGCAVAYRRQVPMCARQKLG